MGLLRNAGGLQKVGHEMSIRAVAVVCDRRHAQISTLGRQHQIRDPVQRRGYKLRLDASAWSPRCNPTPIQSVRSVFPKRVNGPNPTVQDFRFAKSHSPIRRECAGSRAEDLCVRRHPSVDPACRFQCAAVLPAGHCRDGRTFQNDSKKQTGLICSGLQT